MMTLAEIEMTKEDDVPNICVDIDDNGYAYLKQDDDWVALPRFKVTALIAALQEVHIE